MKKYFKLLTIIIVIVWVTAFSNPHAVLATASNKNIVVNSGMVQHPYLSIQATSGSKTILIRPGMTKQQIDQLLGKSVELEMSNFKGYSYGDGLTIPNISVGYLNGKAASIYASGYKISLSGQFKFGTPWKSVLTKLGQPSRAADGIYDYVFQWVNGKLKRIYGDAIQAGMGRPDVYTLSFYTSTSGNIQAVKIEQAAFTQSMEDRLKNPDPTKPTFAEEEIIGIFNGENKPISLGMSREAVEKTNGKPDGQYAYSMVTMNRYGSVSVYYREERVAAILIESPSGVLTSKARQMPTSRAEVLRLYGEPTFNERMNLSYKFEVFSGRLQAMGTIKSTDSRYWKNEKYALSFIFSDRNANQLESVILHDFAFYYDEYNMPMPKETPQ